jgi:PAS domain S-box-containing protein
MRNGLLAETRDCPSWFSVLGFCAHVWFTMLGILLCALPSSAATEQSSAKNVLVLFHDFEQRTTFLDLFESSVRARFPGEVTFYEAYVEFPQGETAYESYLESEAEAFRRRYAGLKLDLVIAVAPPAVFFTVQYRDRIFPGVPIVFTGIGIRGSEWPTWPGVTGVTFAVGVGETIDLALRLQPDTNAIAVISAKDPFWLAATHSEILRYRDKVREIDFLGPPGRELFEKVAALPPHTVVLFHLAPRQSGQPPLAGYDLIDAVAQRLPTYSAWASLCLDHGCIGGAYPDAGKQILQVADIATRVLSGERPDNIPIAHNSDLQVRVDWRALRRWHIPESALPPGSVVLYRPPNFWAIYRQYILTGIFVILVQAVAICALLWQRARRRKTEAELRESEGRFRLVASTAPVMIWMSGTDKLCTYFNQPWLEFTGRSLQEELGNGWVEGVHAGDLESCLDTYSAAFDRRAPFQIEYRLRRHDGEYRWILDYGVPRFNADGSFAGYIGSASDVTERKVAAEALSSVSRKLIEAHEEERTWIARELHDDVNQRLALLAVTLDVVKRDLPAAATGTRQSIGQVSGQVKDLGIDIQALSHRLHSSKLQYLGLAAACRGFCREISERQSVEIEFYSDSLPTNLSKEISLCLFRVLQEALQNASKYSGVREFQVSLKAASNEVELSVHDSGCGFDPEKAISGQGLGLTSMRERLKLVDGQLSINSKPGRGTTIHARVPLSPKAMPAAASE